MANSLDHNHDHGHSPSSGATGTIGATSSEQFDPRSIIFSLNTDDYQIGADGWHSSPADIGTGITVTYAFPTERVKYIGDKLFLTEDSTYEGFTLWNESQIELAEYALDLLESYTQIKFDRVTNAETADMVFHQADLGSRNGGQSDTKLAGAGYYATETNDTEQDKRFGDVYIHREFYDQEAEYAPGLQSHMVMLHEIGHTLGFIDILENMTIDGIAEHHRGNTIMSYRKSPQSGEYITDPDNINEESYEPATYMIYDIAALQYLYGTNHEFMAGNTVYNLGPNGIYFDQLRAIWDGGGTDTLDASQVTESVTLTLIDGTYSSVGNVENFGIAFNAIIENAKGGSGDDVIIGNDVNNYLYGNAGDDLLEGGAGNDRLYSGTGNDEAHGGTGNDLFIYQGGVDTYDGESGTDTAYFLSLNKAVYVDLAREGNNAWHKGGTDLYSTAAWIEIADFTNIENVIGSRYLDALLGDENRNTLQGRDGNDFLYGQGGNDYLYGQNGDDYIEGNEGNDVLIGGAGGDQLDGGDGTDRASYADAKAGVVANLSDSSVNTGDANGDVYISIENLQGSKYDDTLTGDAGRNTIYAGQGNDTLDGGAGNDTLVYQSGTGTFDGGTGTDTAHFLGFDKALYVRLGDEGGNAWHKDGEDLYSNNPWVTVGEFKNIENIIGTNESDVFIGDDNANTLQGRNGDDLLMGEGGNDRLYGQNDDDALSGGDGADRLYGQNGDDKLRGDAGNDLLYGGAGADEFIFDAINAFDGWDRIMDFSSAAGDFINFQGLLDGFDAVTDAVSDFIFVTESSGHTTINVDRDGDGNAHSAERVVRVDNVSNEWSDAADMIAQGDLLI